ncbi:unnamed protein product [Cochlearia groenlandica]
MELDLTLKLGLPSPTVQTHLTLNTPNTDQSINVVDGNRRNNVDGGEIHLRRNILCVDGEGSRNNVDVNIRVYNYIFNHFAGIGETLNFTPYPMPPSPAPAPETPTGSDYVLFDVPARRAQRNKALAILNAMDANANANLKRRRDCDGCCGWRNDAARKCTNINCNAISTPMWRRGPLGPKSLCNACGIKFRKEEERKSKRNL